MITRLDPKNRRRIIIDAARKYAASNGIENVTHENIVSFCDVQTSEATIRRYFHTTEELRNAVSNTARK